MKQNIQAVIDKIKLSDKLTIEQKTLAEFYITKYDNLAEENDVDFDSDATDIVDMFTWKDTALGFYFWYTIAKGMI